MSKIHQEAIIYADYFIQSETTMSAIHKYSTMLIASQRVMKPSIRRSSSLSG